MENITEPHVTLCAANVDHSSLKYYHFMCKKKVQYCKKTFFASSVRFFREIIRCIDLKKIDIDNAMVMLSLSVYLLITSFLNRR